MAKRDTSIIKKYTEKHKKHSTRQRVLIAVASLVVFCTTYAMILPAITMEGKVNCGKEEHIHQHNCYTKEKTLVCQLEEGKIHLHEENCYNKSGELICKADTSTIHTHTDECYKDKMVMSCQKVMHEHSNICVENVDQTAEKPTTVVDELTTETITAEIPTESASQEISKLDNEKSEVESGANDSPIIKNLQDYLSEIIKVGDEYVQRGTVEHKILDDNQQPVVDTTIISGEGYIFSLDLFAYGIEEGTYQYVLPAEIYLPADSYEGEIESESEATGKYTAKREATVVITLVFDDKINGVQNFEGLIEFTINLDNGGEKPSDPAVSKEGAFNAADGMFDFKIDATIPSHYGNEKFKEWYLYDESRITNTPSSTWTQSLDNSVISITYNEKSENGEVVPNTYPVKKITDVTADDKIAYIWFEDYLYLVNRCSRCTESLCGHRSSNRESVCASVAEVFGEEYSAYTDWCTCWNLNKNATLSIEYKNNYHPKKNTDILLYYPGKKYINEIFLGHLANDRDTISADIDVPIPNLVEKALSQNFDFSNNYRGEYTILVNKSMIDLSKVDSNNDGIPESEIVIKDTMTNVTYIPGTISILATDLDGNSVELKYGTDYEVEYTPGSGETSAVYNSSMNIALKKLGPYTYNIKYKAQAIADKDEGTATTVKTSNTATVMVYSFPSDTYGYDCYFNQNWSYLKRILTIEKIDKDDGSLLSGAVYGLYTEGGYLIAEGTTVNGLYDFKTNVREGIIFQDGSAYYVEELDAPDGYTVDSKKYWFYFSEESKLDSLEVHIKVLDKNADIMPCGLSNDDEDDDFNIMVRTNEKSLTLPETGGCGTVIYSLAGGILLLGSAYALYKKFLNWKGCNSK